MKIDSNKIPENQGANRGAQNIQKNAGAEQKAPVEQTRKPGAGDTVDISARSKEIADMTAAVNQLPEVREQKVQEIKKTVDAGTYSMDPRKIAKAIIDEI
jgi:flagellar biosynthesis anti-sigma factor FlgM